MFSLVEAFIGDEGVDGGSEDGGEEVKEDKGRVSGQKWRWIRGSILAWG